MQYITNTSEPKNVRKFPEGFKFGVATAAYQIEGAWDADGKTPSIWDTMVHQKPSVIADGTSGDVACDSYHFLERDLQMVEFMNVDFYRFSISWPRILPTGFPDRVNTKGIDYYNRLIDRSIELGIEPVATIYHWDLPQKLQDLGGWANPNVVQWFEDYSRVLYENFGDRVKTWITVNEPKQICVFGYGMDLMAPALNVSGVAEYMSIKNMLLAHARAWRLYDREFRGKQKGVCGITIATDFRCGISGEPDDVEAGLDAIEFEIGLYSHPIFSSSGGFPERVVRRIAKRSKEQGYPRSRLPDLTREEVELIRGTSDFFGFNHYSTKFYTRKSWKEGIFPVPSYEDDIGAEGSYLDEVYNFEKGAVPHTTIIPGGIRRCLNWVKDNCGNPPVMIFENGFGTFGGLDDNDRLSYYRRYINSILDAIEIDRCDVKCYTAWSLMDNFEWKRGLAIKFGLFEVDFEDDKRTRRARKSALWFRKMAATKTFDPYYEPDLKEVSF